MASDPETPEGELVSVVVTGYRRPDELRRTVESCRSTSQYQPVEWILADDGSPRAMQEEMRRLGFDRCVFARHNRGLAENANAGLAVASGAYVLQLQDDWLCRGPGDFLTRGLQLLAARPDVGMVRFTSLGLPEPDERHQLTDGPLARIYRPRPDSEIFLYSDHPHLKHRQLIDFIGPYRPHRYMQRTELDMRDRFNAQQRYSVAFLEGYEVFEHIGEDVSHRKPLPIERLGRLLQAIPGVRRLLDRRRERRA